MNVKTLPGADCNSDHEMLSITLKLKVAKLMREIGPVCYDFSKITEEYTVEVSNKFSILLQDISQPQLNEIAERAKKVSLEVAQKYIPKKRRKIKPWIANATLDKMEERQKLKGQKDESNKGRYAQLCKEIKRSCKEDKKRYREMYLN